MGTAFSSPLSVAGDGGDNAREDEEGAAGTANCTVHGNHKSQEKNDLLPQEDGDGLMAPNDRELEGVRQQQESGFNSQQKRQTMPSMISSSSSNKRNRTSNDKEAPTMVTTTATATRKMTGLDTVATIAMTHPKNPKNFYSAQPNEKGPNNGAAAPPPVQQRRRQRRLRDRQPSSSSKKKQRLMPGHNTNAEKDPRVFAAEDEGYEKTARALLKEQGFDPDDVRKADKHGQTPMIRFCCLGHLAMCRYLISRDADCRKTDSRFGFFPMYYAAAGGHLEIMKLLARDGGAHEDVRKHNRNLEFTEVLARDLDPDVHEGIRRQQKRSSFSPLRIAVFQGHFHVVQWLLRNEALSTVSGDDIDVAILRNDLQQDIYSPHKKWNHDHRLTVFLWARDVVTTHDNVLKLPLPLAKGKSDILELIAQYVAGNPSQIRTLRQLLNHLPALISEESFVEEVVVEV